MRSTPESDTPPESLLQRLHAGRQVGDWVLPQEILHRLWSRRVVFGDEALPRPKAGGRYRSEPEALQHLDIGRSEVPIVGPSHLQALARAIGSGADLEVHTVDVGTQRDGLITRERTHRAEVDRRGAIAPHLGESQVAHRLVDTLRVEAHAHDAGRAGRAVLVVRSDPHDLAGAR